MSAIGSASGSSMSESIEAKSKFTDGAGSGSGLTAAGAAAGLAGIICAGESASGSAPGLDAIGQPTGRGAGAAAAGCGFGAGLGVGGGAVDASSSAMICRMDERISSIDGSFGAGLFIKASFQTGRRAQSPQSALDSSRNTLTAERVLREARTRGAVPSSPRNLRIPHRWAQERESGQRVGALCCFTGKAPGRSILSRVLPCVCAGKVSAKLTEGAPLARSGLLIERPQLLPDVLDLGDVVLAGLD